MAIEFDRTSMIIPPTIGPQAFNGAITFPGGIVIQKAAVALEGFDLHLENAAGAIVSRRIATMRVDTQLINFVGDVVNFQVSLDLSDTTPTEPYSGNVSVFAIVEH